MKNDRRNSKPEKLISILNQTLDKMGLAAGLSRSSIVELWPKIVEPAVAKHAQAEKVTGSVLHVNVDSSVWMNELSSIRHILLKKINGMLHDQASPITEIRFHQRSWVTGKSELPKKSESSGEPKLSDSEKGRIRATLDPVSDPELRDVLERLMEKDQLSRK